MAGIAQQLRALMNDPRGVIALEYGLIAVLMGMAIISAFTSIWAPLSPGFMIIGNFLISATASGF